MIQTRGFNSVATLLEYLLDQIGEIYSAMATEVSIPEVDEPQKYTITLHKADDDGDNAETSNGSNDTSALQQQSVDDVKPNGSTNNAQELNESQRAFLESCEQDFANRYTSDDPEYEKLVNEGIGDPPIVAPWYTKPRRNYDWSNRDRRNTAHRNEPYRRSHGGHRFEPHRNRDRDYAGYSNNAYRDRYHRGNDRSDAYAQRRYY